MQLKQDGQPVAWDKLLTGYVEIDAILTGSPFPPSVVVDVKSLDTDKVVQTTLTCLASECRGYLDVSNLPTSAAGLTVAALVNESVDEEYAHGFMDRLGVPAANRRGVASGTGDSGRSVPPANVDYFRAAGYETFVIMDRDGAPLTRFFVPNQAKVFLYIGHGWHDPATLYLEGTVVDDAHNGWDPTKPQIRPCDNCSGASPQWGWATRGIPSVGTAWSLGLKTVLFFGCSQLDINNYSSYWPPTWVTSYTCDDADPSAPKCCAGPNAELKCCGGPATVSSCDTCDGWCMSYLTESPGLKWLQVLGPTAWIGFQGEGPTFGGQNGEAALYSLAANCYGVTGCNWVDAWRRASGADLHHNGNAAAIESCSGADYYYYWAKDSSGNRTWTTKSNAGGAWP